MPLLLLFPLARDLLLRAHRPTPTSVAQFGTDALAVRSNAALVQNGRNIHRVECRHAAFERIGN
jgi:hypothetical protein